MAAPRKYPDELREWAVRLVLEAKKDPAARAGACRRISEQLGINSETLRGWVKQVEIDAGDRPGTTTSDAARLAGGAGTRGQGVAPGELDPSFGIGFLRGGARPPVSLICEYIEAAKAEHGVEPICTALSGAGVKIAPSTYYAARGRPPSVRAVRDEAVKVEIARVHKANYDVYGIRKVHAQLRREGIAPGGRPVARCTTGRLMKSLGLKGISRAKGPKTHPRHRRGHPPGPRRSRLHRYRA